MFSFKEFFIKLVLTSVAFIIAINMWFHMGSCIELAFLYSFIAVITYIVKQVVNKNKGKTKKVQPNYKKKMKMEIDKAKRKRKREIIKADIKKRQKERAIERTKNQLY